MLYLLQPRFERNNTIGNCRIDFELAPQSIEDMLKALSVQKVDMAIDTSADGHRSYHTDRVHSDDLVLVCAEGHPRIKGEITMDQYATEEHVALMMRRSGKRALDVYALDEPAERKVVFECDSLMSMLALVSRGQLICAAPRSVAAAFAESLKLKLLAPPFNLRPLEHFLIAHRRLDSSPAHQWLKDTLLAALRNPG